MEMVEKKNKMTLVVLSGDMDKVMAAYIIASGAAPTGDGSDHVLYVLGHQGN